MGRNQVFISYSHSDLRHLERFQEAVSPYLPDFPLQTWDDRRIRTGDNWKQEIEKALASAKIAVLLVTPSFLASEFVKRKELPAILKAQQADGLIVFWIPINYAAYKAVQLDEFQAALDPERPLLKRTGADRDKAWLEIAEKLMEAAGVAVDAEPARPRIVLLHRQGSHPDEEIVDVLDEGLKQHGYDVFTYQRISTELLNQLDNHLNRADAVVPLISKKSESSEILEMHVLSARQKAEKQGGRPRLVPVLVQYSEVTNSELGKCAELPHVAWTGPADNNSLCSRVLEILKSSKDAAKRPAESKSEPPAACATTPQVRIVNTGEVPRDRYYIVRSTDDQMEKWLSGWEGLIRIKGSRQMGKTSLLGQAVRSASRKQAKVAFTDYQSLNSSQLSNLDTLYRTLGESLLDALGLDSIVLDNVWNTKKTPNWNLERLMKRQILAAVDTHLVWAMDEVERLFPFDYAQEFFRLLRSWYTTRTVSPEFEKLTILISYATEAHLFLPDINESPFNVGRELLLSDFTVEQVAELNQRYGSPLKDETELRQFYALLGGQPFLVREGLEWLKPPAKLAVFLLRADTEGGPFGDHLRWLQAMLARHAALGQAVRAYLTAGQPLSDDEFYRLRAAGLFSGESPDAARLRCGLYENHLRKRFGGMQMKQGA